jgi:hypothetical protein
MPTFRLSKLRLSVIGPPALPCLAAFGGILSVCHPAFISEYEDGRKCVSLV